ncbi:MAG: hypothetical protein ACRD8Z_13385 [Nitrososphaeraceae archaeon]
MLNQYLHFKNYPTLGKDREQITGRVPFATELRLWNNPTKFPGGRDSNYYASGPKYLM